MPEKTGKKYAWGNSFALFPVGTSFRAEETSGVVWYRVTSDRGISTVQCERVTVGENWWKVEKSAQVLRKYLGGLKIVGERRFFMAKKAVGRIVMAACDPAWAKKNPFREDS